MNIAYKTGWWITGGLIVAGSATALWLYARQKTENSLSDPGRYPTQNHTGVSNPNRTATALQEPQWSDPFNTDYMAAVIQWVSPIRIIKLKDNYADQLAQKAHRAKGRWFFSDDDEKAVGHIFGRLLRDKVQVSNLATAFFKRYKEPLKPFLQSFLNETEMKTHVLKPLQQLPNYRKT